MLCVSMRSSCTVWLRDATLAGATLDKAYLSHVGRSRNYRHIGLLGWCLLSSDHLLTIIQTHCSIEVTEIWRWQGVNWKAFTTGVEELVTEFADEMVSLKEIWWAACHPRGAINLKISPWVTGVCVLCNAAGKVRSNVAKFFFSNTVTNELTSWMRAFSQNYVTPLWTCESAAGAAVRLAVR